MLLDDEETVSEVYVGFTNDSIHPDSVNNCSSDHPGQATPCNQLNYWAAAKIKSKVKLGYIIVRS